jgi:hypothetical protein
VIDAVKATPTPVDGAETLETETIINTSVAGSDNKALLTNASPAHGITALQALQVQV